MPLGASNLEGSDDEQNLGASVTGALCNASGVTHRTVRRLRVSVRHSAKRIPTASLSSSQLSRPVALNCRDVAINRFPYHVLAAMRHFAAEKGAIEGIK